MARRRLKRGNTRMDAALDAMGPMGMGFPKDSVRQTVKELLKVYGGDEGWPFIEENCYSILLDALVEKQQNDFPQKDVSQDDARKDIEPSTAESSCGVMSEAVNAKLPTDDALNSVSQSTKALDFEAHTSEAGAEDCNNPPTKEERRGDCNDDKLDINFGTTNMDDVQDFGTNEHLGCVKDSGSDKRVANTPFHSTKLEGFASSRKRRPYHGWISGNDDNDDNNLVELTPIPLPEGLEKLFRVMVRRNTETKTSWDVRPEDV
ncbi:WIYLD domain containing protein [Parasponia andersonii]|uniref:WIYLD domain containing protein n=1 Tax=Parasponia andersonii TaxID=3476 RepID=A0A2P5D6V6_PARAD|nr:WIYLD domain containing protein [Parasponia andersonii]